MCDSADAHISITPKSQIRIVVDGEHSLCGVGLVVHKEKLEVAGIVDEEGLVAGRHHVAGLLVVAIADLHTIRISITIQTSQKSHASLAYQPSLSASILRCHPLLHRPSFRVGVVIPSA